MATDRGWPALLADYKAAVERFDKASKSLTAALVNRKSETFPELFEAEASARNAVVATRLRLLNAWGDSTRTDLELQQILGKRPKPR